MRNSIYTLTATLLFAHICPAADKVAEAKHPIDVKIEKLANDANSTAESTDAYEQGLKLWDREMNRVYQELKKALPEKQFAALKASQVQWLNFRDTQITFINSCHDQYEGTMFLPMRASAIMEVTRARALELLHRLEVHKEHAGQ